jgi:hypothetical protein
MAAGPPFISFAILLHPRHYHPCYLLLWHVLPMQSESFFKQPVRAVRMAKLASVSNITSVQHIAYHAFTVTGVVRFMRM